MRWWFAMCLILLLAVPGMSQNAETADDLASRALSFFHTAAEYIGSGLMYLLNLVLPGEAPADFEAPLGYLGLLTLILFVFGIVSAARKVIWLLVGIGWILMVVRIILHAVGAG